MAKVMFLQPIWFPQEAVMSLSAALKQAGHESALSVGPTAKWLREVERFKPDVVAIPTITPFRKFMINSSKALRDGGYKGIILVGGYDASFFPQIINLAPIDAICIGEGDGALVELADALDAGKDWSFIKNLWVKREKDIIKNPLRPFVDVNKKPLNDRDIYRSYDSYFSDIEFEQITVGRGCPYRCGFCYNHAYRQVYGKLGRDYCALREPQRVIEEIEGIAKSYPNVKSIFFNDSTLGYNKKWLLEFCRLYTEHGIRLPFTINMCMNEVDEEVCRALASTKKCFLIRIGLESGNEKFRTTVLNKPLCTDKVCREATRLLRKHRLKFSLQIMLGLPGEKFEWACQTLEMARELSARNTVVAVNIFKPFPKIDLTAYGVKIGAYDENMINDTELIGSNVMNIFDNFRLDAEGKKINNLARLSHIYMRFPFMRGPIKRWLVNMPDNKVFRFIQQYSDYYYSNRHHINASWRYLLKYWLVHRKKISDFG